MLRLVENGASDETVFVYIKSCTGSIVAFRKVVVTTELANNWLVWPSRKVNGIGVLIVYAMRCWTVDTQLEINPTGCLRVSPKDGQINTRTGQRR
ncbi:hypothetical protein RRG08_023229 [Elysia crispata]|uniref:Uncharacterized protein n=1 Tax=Elysia crispata TaxID=231223 RepID=A0AAE0ZPT6_9GAST|nr:hypothetical protein RRG08_023229 [Elysia crispata]